ncbi:MAG TPA: hypothetical protein VGG65_06415 [Thermoanaerobaculia bacterium]
MKALVRVLLALALAAQVPLSDLGPGAEETPRPPELSCFLLAGAQIAPATGAWVRSDAPDDADDSDFDEAGAACLPSVSAIAGAARQPIAAPLPLGGGLIPSQHSPGPGPSRAPPIR